ncbi:MAG: UDP-N-acetylglucosamine 2-epimerase (non-hydrolyzing) [Armatimonadota bacterium]|nr:UDP-N-acetylglucosamine 2-epimerase (non-hydrolyzing) [Armatimonadota bacterium]
MAKIVTVLGTRPEIIKLSPLLPLLYERYEHILVHTGQHYSHEMDGAFFAELGLRQADYALGVGSGAHGEQTGRMLARLEPVLLAERPDAVLVQGDTNTTLAGALCAAKLNIFVIHLEAGGRSFNRFAPEELNRIIVDHIANLLLAPDQVAYDNLIGEGLPPERIRMVGSSAIDAVQRNQTLAAGSAVLDRLGLQPGNYVALTLHRAENTTRDTLPGILRAIQRLAQEVRIVFPVHPRTAHAIEAMDLRMPPEVLAIDPLGYLDMIKLVACARALLTDSGGLQEEAAVLGTPVLVLRNETEWRYLVDAGCQTLIGNTCEAIIDGARHWLEPEALAKLRSSRPPIRPGASLRALDAISEYVPPR